MNNQNRKSLQEKPVRRSAGGRPVAAASVMHKRSSSRPSGGGTSTKIPPFKSARTTMQGGPRSSSAIPGTSSMRTPMSVRSLSANRFTEKGRAYLTPNSKYGSSRKSVFAVERPSRASGRESASGSRSVKDNRPLQDKSYQASQYKRIIDFLRENNYVDETLKSKNTPLTAKQFTNIFNFIYSHINPSKPQVLPYRDAEERILRLLKEELHYPGTVTKSTLKTMGSLHSWPTILGFLSFLCQSAILYQKLQSNIIPLAFPSKDEQGIPIDRESCSKLKVEHSINSFQAFMAGQDNLSEQRSIYRERLLENSQIDSDQMRSLEEELQSLEDVIRSLKSQSNNLNTLKEKLTTEEQDFDKVKGYLQDWQVNRAGHLKKEERLKAMFEDVCRKLQEKTQLLQELTKDGSGPHQLNPQMEGDKRRRIKQVVEQLDTLDKEHWELEVQFYRTVDDLEKMSRDFNSICREVELKDGDNFLTLPVPDWNDGIVTQAPGIFDLPTHLEADLREKQRSNQQEMEEWNARTKNLEARKEDMKRLKERNNKDQARKEELEQKLEDLSKRIEREEAALDKKLAQLKLKLTQLRDENQEERVRLEQHIEEKQTRLEKLVEHKENRKRDGEAFLEAAGKTCLRHIKVSTKLRDKAEKTVNDRRAAHVTAVKEAHDKLDAIEQEIAEMMSVELPRPPNN